MPDPDATDVLPVTSVHDPADRSADDRSADDHGADVLDDGWDAPARKTSKLTLLLIGGVVVALGFGAGVLVQKNHDSTLLGGALRARPAVGGAPAGRAPGGEQQPGGTPVVVGTVSGVTGETLTITDFGGTAVRVTVPGTATVSANGLGHPKVGDPVAVNGTKGADGAVTATSVTVRSGTG
jgi:hypothetical protein